MSKDVDEYNANARMEEWRDLLLEAVRRGSSASYHMLQFLVEGVKSDWRACRAKYRATKQASNNPDPYVPLPEFPGRIMYMRLLRNPANTMLGWCPDVMSKTCNLALEVARELGPGQELAMSDLYISTCIMDPKGTGAPGPNQLGEDFKSVTFTLTTVVLSATEGSPDAAVQLYKNYLDDVFSIIDYRHQHVMLTRTLTHNAQNFMTKHMVRSAGVRPLLSANAIPSVRTASSAAPPAAAAAGMYALPAPQHPQQQQAPPAPPPAEEAAAAAAPPAAGFEDFHANLEALFAGCSISMGLQSVATAGAT